MAYSTYSSFANGLADQYGIPRGLFAGLIQHESGWNPNPPGWNDGGLAVGFGQLHAGAAEEVGVNRYDPFDNLRGAAKYLSKQYKATGNWDTALARYNQGPGASASLLATKGASYAASVNAAAKSFGYDGDGSHGRADASVSTPGGDVYPNLTADTSGTEGVDPGQTNDSILGNWMGALNGVLPDSVKNAVGGMVNGASADVNSATGGALGTPATPSDSMSSQVGGFLSQLSQLFTAEFWRTVFFYLALGALAIAAILIGLWVLAKGAGIEVPVPIPV